MKLLRRFADRRDARSLSAGFRRRRSAHFLELLGRIPKPVRILDAGGEEAFWNVVPAGEGVSVILANIEPQTPKLPNVTAIVADACDLSRFADGEFDLVVSNSVIEHVADMEAMAREVRRVGRRYYVQTPNRWFPIEPHFLVPFFQFLPMPLRARLLTRFNLGWLTRTPDRAAARAVVESVRLIDARELRRLFPGGTVWRERFLGLTKSLVVYGGW